MDSSTLRMNKVIFEKSVSKYCEKYNEMINKINQINLLLEESDDNLLYSFLYENNEKTKEKIKKLLDNILEYEKITVMKVNQKIEQLEYEEHEREKRLQEMKALEER